MRRERQLQDLIRRARIFLKEGRWLMGIVDEAGVLEVSKGGRNEEGSERLGGALVLPDPASVQPCMRQGS